MSDQGHEHHSDFVPRRFLLAEFATPDGAARRHDEDARGRATRTSTRTRRSRSTASRRRSGLKRPKIPLIVLCGAIAGACIAYSLIYFCNVFDWPLNIGNRPPHGPPANIPITFELAVLLGGGSSFIGLLRAGEAAAALPPGLRVGGLRARVRRRVLPVGRAAARAPTSIARWRTSAPRARCRARSSRSPSDDAARASDCRWRPRSSRSPDRPVSTRTSSIRWRTASRRRTATARASSTPTA